VTRLELENDMQAAVERGEFVLYYQPILNFADGKTTGFEALLRWQHPKYGLLQPGQFLPIAEETGFIVSLGEWVLREACRQMVEWRERYPNAAGLTISVNISGDQVTRPNFASQVELILRETGLEPTALRLEITETVLLEGAEGTLNTIRHLRSMGIRLEIDDFGTGYSALSYIQRFPVDTIKIDRSFVESIGAPDTNIEFIRSILRFAAGLNLNTIAEGIETEEQMRVLKDLMCPYGQGYFISRPLKAEDCPGVFGG
jgi:EAL domain-containing protein (putative c-di-GMP-specific phosphodiesterase class I)